MVSKTFRKNVLKFGIVCYIFKFCYHCYHQIPRDKKMSHPIKGRSTRNAMPGDFTCGFPTIKLDACRGISTVVGTKARGYTVTRKIVPALGPKSHPDNISNFKECWLFLVFSLLELCWCCCHLWCRCRCVEGNSGCSCVWLYCVFL